MSLEEPNKKTIPTAQGVFPRCDDDVHILGLNEGK